MTVIDTIVEWFIGIAGRLDYFGVFFLMVVESSFIPFPSELVIPPAAFLAARGEMSIFLVILFGTLGSLVGAWVNYFLALFLGKPVVYALVRRKWAKWFLLSEAKLERAERYFLKYGVVSTFVGRLLPVIRQLISLPAGFVKMNFGIFSLFTFLGAGIWITVLALLGYFFGLNENFHAYVYVKLGLAGCGVVFIFVAWFVRRRRKKG